MEPQTSRVLCRAQAFFDANQEVLVVSGYGAGDRDYMVAKSLNEVLTFIRNTAPEYKTFAFGVFPASQLVLHGIVNSEFLKRAISLLTEVGPLVVIRMKPGDRGIMHGNDCDTIEELREEFSDLDGQSVAIGRSITLERLVADMNRKSYSG
ncbi:MAG: hypothetical protein R3C28_03285 [Pirellulaceae bacterium]